MFYSKVMESDPWPSLHGSAPLTPKKCDSCAEPAPPTPYNQTQCPNILPLAVHMYSCVFAQFVAFFSLTSYNKGYLQKMKTAGLQ